MTDKEQPNGAAAIAAQMRTAIKGFANCAPELARINAEIRRAVQGLGTPAIQRQIAHYFATTPTPEGRRRI